MKKMIDMSIFSKNILGWLGVRTPAHSLLVLALYRRGGHIGIMFAPRARWLWLKNKTSWTRPTHCFQNQLFSLALTMFLSYQILSRKEKKCIITERFVIPSTVIFSTDFFLRGGPPAVLIPLMADIRDI